MSSCKRSTRAKQEDSLDILANDIHSLIVELNKVAKVNNDQDSGKHTSLWCFNETEQCTGTQGDLHQPVRGLHELLRPRS